MFEFEAVRPFKRKNFEGLFYVMIVVSHECLNEKMLFKKFMVKKRFKHRIYDLNYLTWHSFRVKFLEKSSW